MCAEIQVDAAAVIDWENSNSARAVIAIQECLKIRPPFVLEGSEIAAETKSIDNGVKALPVPQRLGIRVGHAMLRASLYFFGGYATEQKVAEPIAGE